MVEWSWSRGFGLDLDGDGRGEVLVNDEEPPGRLEFSASVDGELALVMDLAASPAAVVRAIGVNKKVWPAADDNGDRVNDFAVEHPHASNQGPSCSRRLEPSATKAE